MNKSTVSIETCPRCSEGHEDIEITAYRSQCPPYTHWYVCPKSHEPASVSLVTVSGHHAPLRSEVATSLSRGMASGQYLVAVFRMEDGKQHLDRTANNFPTGEYLRSIKLLEENLMDEAGPPPKTDLPQAPKQSPTISLFGQDGARIITK